MADSSMSWDKLLSKRRQGRPNGEEPTIGRSDFQRDYDRIVYSSAFRRLQDKAQVFPLAKSDFVRTRLTHSLEVSCVGRSLGTEIGLRLTDAKRLPKGIHPGDVGSIVASACLAHDIGNPPFGHAGEAAIQEWFRETEPDRKTLEGLDPSQKSDFELFEGNAQGFRVLTQLQNAHNPGLQLCSATLAAFTIYPRESCLRGESLNGVSWKKHGYFQTEKAIFGELAQEVGLIRRNEACSAWTRHPLAYLVEAADDICYRINDLEDGFRLKHVTLEDTQDLLLPIFDGRKAPSKHSFIKTPEDKVGYLRAKTINELINQVVDCFEDQEKTILNGEQKTSLIESIPSSNALDRIIKVSKEKIYGAREVLEIEVPGFRVLAGLLEAFLSAANDVTERGKEGAATRSKRILQLIPCQVLGENLIPDEDRYLRTLKVTDFVSGMTDSFAVALFKQITGISLATG